MVNFYSDKADGTSMDWAFAEAGISLAYTVEMWPTRLVMLLLTCGLQVLKRCLKPAPPPPQNNKNFWKQFNPQAWFIWKNGCLNFLGQFFLFSKMFNFISHFDFIHRSWLCHFTFKCVENLPYILAYKSKCHFSTKLETGVLVEFKKP